MVVAGNQGRLGNWVVIDYECQYARKGGDGEHPAVKMLENVEGANVETMNCCQVLVRQRTAGAIIEGLRAIPPQLTERKTLPSNMGRAILQQPPVQR